MSKEEAGLRYRCQRVYLAACLAIPLVAAALPARTQQVNSAADQWLQTVHEQIKHGKLDAALTAVEQRLALSPGDLEAHGWRGRLLAWKGRWLEAENEYRLVLQQVPEDVEILIALADVLVWQEKLRPALEIIDRARGQSPADQEILQRRARILHALGRKREARAQLRELLHLYPQNVQAKSELGALNSEYKHELRLGNDIDTFNYTDTAQTQNLVLSSRWNRHWSTIFNSSFYQRFGQQAQKFAASSIFRMGGGWLELSAAGANDHGIVPRSEVALEFGRGLRIHNSWIRGWEGCYQQRWLWYAGAHVLTLAVAQTYYLPRDWTWNLTVTGARSGFANTGVEWVPSGSTRLGFPLNQRWSGNFTFAVGSENYAQVDQIGRFSAQTFAGGLRFRFAANQDVSGYVARQNRTQQRSQTSYGVSYGIRF